MKATGTTHTELILLLLLMTSSFKIDFVVDWYFFQSLRQMVLQDKIFCVFSMFLHLTKNKSDATILSNSPVISLLVPLEICDELGMPGVF